MGAGGEASGPAGSGGSPGGAAASGKGDATMDQQGNTPAYGAPKNNPTAGSPSSEGGGTSR